MDGEEREERAGRGGQHKWLGVIGGMSDNEK